MTTTRIRPRPPAAAIAIEAFDAATSHPQASLSGFRLAEPNPAGARANRASGQPELKAVAGHGSPLPLAIGFEAGAARQVLLSADADALPMDGTWRWLGPAFLLAVVHSRRLAPDPSPALIPVGDATEQTKNRRDD